MDDATDHQAFTAKQFRDVLSTFATGVTVITTVTATGERLGATASSFNSVSLDPPLVLFSIARNAKAFKAWQSADSYAINILGEHQDDISTRFARPMTDKWRDVSAVPGTVTGHPLLAGALAAMECRSYARYDGGDHVIMVGRVLSLRLLNPLTRPLIFFDSRYHKLDFRDDIPTPLDTDIWLHGW